MFSRRRFLDLWKGLLEDAITDLAHLLQDGFEFSVIGNRCLVEGDLLLGESDADFYRFFRPPTPCRSKPAPFTSDLAEAALFATIAKKPCHYPALQGCLYCGSCFIVPPHLLSARSSSAVGSHRLFM